MHRWLVGSIVFALALASCADAAEDIRTRAYPVPQGGHPHDVAVDRAGIVWYTAQGSGQLGRLDPRTGKVALVSLGTGAAPHGVIIGPDGAPWVTEGGTNAIVRVDPKTRAVKRWALPESRAAANLNTATFDRRGRIWFTGQSGIYGRLDPKTGDMRVWDAPRGAGPYGMTTTPDGQVYFASLAGSYIARVDVETGDATVLEPPTADQGARRVWSDSKNGVWVTEWNAGNVARYDTGKGTWRTWKLPGERPMPYAVYVDDQDKVWLSDWRANAILRFDPRTERFEAFPGDRQNASVRQLNGRRGEVWAPESANDRLVVYRRR